MFARCVSRVFGLAVLMVAATGVGLAQDNWLGGTGNWSNGPQWSAGLPGSTSDVLIYSGGNDNVTLNVGASTVNSLTLGGASNGFTSELTDGGTAQTLNINQGLTVGQTGYLLFTGGSSLSVGADSTNAGSLQFFNGSSLSITGNLTETGTAELEVLYGSSGLITGNLVNTGGDLIAGSSSTLTILGTLEVNNFTNNSYYGFRIGSNVATDASTVNAGTLSLQSGQLSIRYGATLNLTSQPGGLTDVAANSIVDVLGTFTAGGNPGLANLNSVEGAVGLFGQNFAITPGSGTLTISSAGELDLGPQAIAPLGTTLIVNGNIDNSGLILTYPPYTLFVVGNTLTLTGTLTNNTNGILDVELGATLQINANVNNSGVVATDYYSFGGGSNTLSINGALTNNFGGNLTLLGNGDVVNVGTLTNNGYTYVGTGAALNLTNQPLGITDVVGGSTFDLAGTFNAGTNNGFYQLTSVEGNLILENGQTTTTTPIGGTFTVGSTGYVEVKTGTTFDINGNLTVNTGGIFSVNDPFPTTVNITGTLTNFGMVNIVGPNAFLNVGGIGNGGMLTLPEGSTVNLANGFYQLASGTLGEAIGTNGYAIIMVNGGLVMLDGTLDVLLDPGYDPAVGSMYKFFMFNPGALSGTFASIENDIFNNGTEKWVVMYNDAGGYVELLAANNSTVPEPSSLLLLGSGLLTLGYGVRRRLLK